jgi:hypothetical protein
MNRVALLLGCLGFSIGVLSCHTNENGSCEDTQTCPLADGGGPNPEGGPSDAGLPDGTIVGPDGAVCDPTQTPAGNACVINNTLAIFVAPTGNDSNPGTKEKPVLTLGHGLTLAQTTTTHRIIACANTYAESITLSAPADDVGLQIFGGVACPGGATAAWTYTGTQAVVKGTGPGPALQATGLTKPIVVQDVELDGPTPAAPGGSSIGAFVSAVSSADFTNVKFVAQSGTNGADGTMGNNDTDGGVLNGNNASDAGPGAAQTCTCQDGTQTAGGAGGSASTPAGAGRPATDDGGAAGLTGATCAGPGSGSSGSDAPVSTLDGGAPTTGTLGASGWTPGNGANGNNGAPGQGGGGGGNGKPGTGAGGGGACGGCGGAGGGGGQAGGSSIALLAYQSGVTLTKCLLVAGSAGAGGNGASGQAGQGGGFAGNSLQGGCQGGTGGNGAGGNGGAGGAGGISAGVAYAKTSPTIDGKPISAANTLSIATLGNGGDAGAAGSGGGAATPSTNAGSAGVLGAPGTSQAVVQVP